MTLILAISVHTAPPLSMWDAPEPQDRGIAFNRFARREVTKATRAAEYWSSEYDEYDLSAPAPRGSRGFKSARENWKSPKVDENASPKKPVVKLPPRNHNLPAPLPFTFNTPVEEKKEVGLGSFAKANTSHLDMLRGLGDDDLPLGDDLIGAGAGAGGGGSSGAGSPAMFGSPRLGGVGRVKDGGADWRSLAGLGGGGATAGSALGMGLGLGMSMERVGSGGSGGAGVKLAGGTKRLGMGRPVPWGQGQAPAKKARQD